MVIDGGHETVQNRVLCILSRGGAHWAVGLGNVNVPLVIRAILYLFMRKACPRLLVQLGREPVAVTFFSAHKQKT